MRTPLQGGRPAYFALPPYPAAHAGSSQDLVYWLDDQSGIPLRVSAFTSKSDFRKDKPSWTWEAVSLDTVDKRLFCMESTHKSSDVEANIHVTSVKFDSSFPPEVFWPEIQKSAMVFDTIENRTIAPKIAKPESKIPVTSPIRADEPRSSALPLVAVALGAAVLVAAILLRIRRGRA